MNRTFLVLLLALGLGVGFLVARYVKPTPAAVEPPKAVVLEERRSSPPVARPARPSPAPVTAEKTDDELAKEEFQARAKAFGEETKKMVEEIAGGDQAKLQRAIFAGMMKPEGQAIMKEWRAFGEAMRTATPAEREALGQQAVALRDRTLNALRTEMEALNNPAPTTPATSPAGAGTAPTQPAPAIIM